MPVFQLLHTVTSTVAMRRVLLYLPEDALTNAIEAVERVSGAMIARVARVRDPAPQDFGALPDRADLIDQAARHRDDHVIKLTEACLNEDARDPDPIFRTLPQAIARRIPPWSHT